MDELREIIDGDVDTKTTEITENFSLEEYLEKNPGCIVLFVTTADGRIRFPLHEGAGSITEGDKITALIRRSSGK
jgi:hypothetical protein